MRDRHQVNVDHIGKVVGGEAVRLEQDPIFQVRVPDGDIAEDVLVNC